MADVVSSEAQLREVVREGQEADARRDVEEIRKFREALSSQNESTCLLVTPEGHTLFQQEFGIPSGIPRFEEAHNSFGDTVPRTYQSLGNSDQRIYSVTDSPTKDKNPKSALSQQAWRNYRRVSPDEKRRIENLPQKNP